jgi:hypothetical protein
MDKCMLGMNLNGARIIPVFPSSVVGENYIKLY